MLQDKLEREGLKENKKLTFYDTDGNEICLE